MEAVEHCRVFSVFQAPRTQESEKHHLILTHYKIRKTENGLENGDIQSQVGWSSETPGLVEDASAY